MHTIHKSALAAAAALALAASGAIAASAHQSSDLSEGVATSASAMPMTAGIPDVADGAAAEQAEAAAEAPEVEDQAPEVEAPEVENEAAQEAAEHFTSPPPARMVPVVATNHEDGDHGGHDGDHHGDDGSGRD